MVDLRSADSNLLGGLWPPLIALSAPWRKYGPTACAGKTAGRDARPTV